MYSGKNYCSWANVVVFWQNGFISAKAVDFGQSGCIRVNVVVFGQKWLY